jgi:integrase
MIPSSDTVAAAATNVIPLPRKAVQPRLAKTRFANLRRDRFSGTYFCWAKVCGRLVRQSLQTKSLEVAKTKLDALLESSRKQFSGIPKLDVDEFRAGHLVTEFRAGVANDSRLKPRSKAFRLFCADKLVQTWPELPRMRLRQVTRDAVESWAEAYRRRGFSGGLFNSTVDTLRMILELAVNRGLLAQNPVRVRPRSSGNSGGIAKAKVVRRLKALPSDSQFRALLKHLKSAPKCEAAALRVAVLAHSGQRPENVRQLRRQDVDLDRKLVHWPPIKHNANVNTQPMSADLFAVLSELVQQHPGDDSPLVPIASAKTALHSASLRLGISPVVTEGLFRHWFTTRALEAGIPVASVAAMRGDKDGGAMLLKTYFHARIESLREHVKKL